MEIPCFGIYFDHRWAFLATLTLLFADGNFEGGSNASYLFLYRDAKPSLQVV